MVNEHRTFRTVGADGPPLAGVRVIELTQGGAGAFAGMLLADLGADVVKVEAPTGDRMRSWPPIAEDPETGERFSHAFASLNRNKRGVVLDLEDAGDVARVRGLVESADVVLEDHGPGVLDGLGLGFGSVTDGRSGGLAYCSVSAYGLTSQHPDPGPDDLVIQGVSGLMSVTGEVTGRPMPAGVPVGDSTAALYAALTVSALLPAVREGRQVHVDCPMLDCLLAVSALRTSTYWAVEKGAGDEEPRRLGTAHPHHAPYQAFRARNGEFTVAAGTDRLWALVAEVAGVPELVDDRRFHTERDRVAHQDVLAGILQARFNGKRVQYWLRELRARGVPCGPVNTFGEALADELVTATGLVQDLKVPVAGVTPTVVYPARVGGLPSRLDRAAPVLGADTDAVLADWGVA